MTPRVGRRILAYMLNLLGIAGDRFESMLWKRRGQVPFSHPNLVKRNLPRIDGLTLVDVGCGDGTTLRAVDPNRRFRSIGIDIHRPSLEKARAAGAHSYLAQSDVCRIPLRDKSADVVLCLEVCEHLPKEEGAVLIEELERIARSLVIISTPVGTYPQGARDGNLHWEHRSKWLPGEFVARGYRVRGSGLRGLGGDDATSRRHPVLKPLHYLASFLASPVSYFFPFGAAHMICVKELDGPSGGRR